MKAVEANLLEFLKKSQQFASPLYQRTYSWTERECQLSKDRRSRRKSDSEDRQSACSVGAAMKGGTVRKLLFRMVRDGQLQRDVERTYIGTDATLRPALAGALFAAGKPDLPDGCACGGDSPPRSCFGLSPLDRHRLDRRIEAESVSGPAWPSARPPHSSSLPTTGG